MVRNIDLINYKLQVNNAGDWKGEQGENKRKKGQT